MSLSEAIKREARALGFDAVGIALVQPPVAPRSSDEQANPPAHHLVDRLKDWLARGYHGAMAWMEREPSRRADPSEVLPGCRSIVSVALNYYTEQRADERPGYGRIARYAWGKDYHQVMGKRLEQLETRIKALAPQAATRWYVDTGPVMEKAWAQQAGLGWVGKHSNLVSTQFGSWLLLGEILTTLELDPDEPGTDLCGSCRLCIQACPTGAISEPYVVDARRCISYLTIELRGSSDSVPPDLASKIGNRIFGCDDCLDVCPYNVHAQPTSEAAFQPSAVTLAPVLADLAGITDSDFRRTFRESPIQRAKHAGLLRNVGNAMRNQKKQAQATSFSSPRMVG